MNSHPQLLLASLCCFLFSCSDAPTVSTFDGGYTEMGIDDLAGDMPHGDTVPPVETFAGTITGNVFSEGKAVEGAIVRFGGRDEHATTDESGFFSLVVSEPPVKLGEIALTAGKFGYYSGGIEVTAPTTEQSIELEKLTLIDDPSYVFKAPDGPDAAPYCIHCHKNQLNPWLLSAHATAASNPKLHDMYNGTASGLTTEASCLAAGGAWRAGKALGKDASQETTAMKCYVKGAGVLPDLNADKCGDGKEFSCDDPQAPANAQPTETGPCGDCHSPANTGHVVGATNLNSIEGVAFNKGIHCDFCHKIQSVEVNDKPGLDGAITILRPAPSKYQWSIPEVIFGPLSDVIISTMGNVYQPQFTKSEFCSGCHQWSKAGFRPEDQLLVDSTKWPKGLPLQDTYNEWKGSDWRISGVQCQNCHMQTIEAETATADLDGEPTWSNGVFGWPRQYGQVHDHTMVGRQQPTEPGYVPFPGDMNRDALRNPVDVSLTTDRHDGNLEVVVSLKNTTAGHSLPTGTPSRQWILVVEATVGTKQLPANGGYTIPQWGGALLSGQIGNGHSLLADNKLALKANAPWPTSAVGMRVHFVKPSGVFDDYPASSAWFAETGRTAKEKGMELTSPVAAASIVSVDGDSATLDSAPTVVDGTLFFLSAAAPTGLLQMDQELPTQALAGTPGYVFAKVMVDKDDLRGVPFFRAVDIASDNRIPPGKTAITKHQFDASSASGQSIEVRASLLYRRYPWQRATERGWQVVDVVRKQTTTTVLP